MAQQVPKPVVAERQVKSWKEYWMQYVSGFNPDVKVKDTRDGFSIEGSESSLQLQYPRKAPALAPVDPEARTSHQTMFKLLYPAKSKDVVVEFQDYSRIAPALTPKGDWKRAVETFAEKYDLSVGSITEAPVKKALFLMP